MAYIDEIRTLQRLADRATKYRVSPDDGGLRIEIVRREQPDGSVLWAIKALSMVLRRNGKLERDPLPLSRSEEFLRRTSFTLDEAVDICDRFDLWNASWVQGQGFTSSKWCMREADIRGGH